MGIEQDLNDRLKEAMKAKNERVLSVLRMVKSLAGTEKTAAGFDGKTDDAFWLGVVDRYSKQQKKALAEYSALGEAGASHVAGIQFELDYLAPFLPQLLGEAETLAIVERIIAETGAADAKSAGKVVGAVMKAHKGQVDAAMVKRLVDQKLK